MAISLIEVVISIVVLTIISITIFATSTKSLEFFEFKKNANLINQNLISTKIFIQNKILGAKDVMSKDSRLEFFEKDMDLITTKSYSGFALLDNNKTSKSKIATDTNASMPNYQIFIGFENGIFEINKIEKNSIYLKDNTNPKQFSENYFLYKKSTFYLSNNKLFYNDQELLDNIKSFDFVVKDNYLDINICIQIDNNSICKNWYLVVQL